MKLVWLAVLLVACACAGEYQGGYGEKVIPLDQSIARFAHENGIDFNKADSVKNSFISSVVFGGAGGIANAEIRQNDLRAFLNETERLNLDTIRYVDTLALPCLTRNFYAFNKRGGPWVVRSEKYCILEEEFEFRELNLTALRYETKRPDQTWLFVSMIVLLAAFAFYALRKFKLI